DVVTLRAHTGPAPESSFDKGASLRSGRANHSGGLCNREARRAGRLQSDGNKTRRSATSKARESAAASRADRGTDRCERAVGSTGSLQGAELMHGPGASWLGSVAAVATTSIAGAAR